MRLKRLKIKNIRSYTEEEVNFPDGSLLLSGDIGSGKSSLLLALEYALFGLQPGQKGASLLRNKEQTGEVELELEVFGSTILIERRLRRGPKTVSNDYSAITIDGEKTESSPTELKTKIIELLGYPQEFVKKNNVLYKYTVYAPQEQMKEIISEDSETRLNVIRHIFGIDKYKRIRENLSILIANLKEGTKILQGEIKNLDQDKERLSSIQISIDQLTLNIQEQEKGLEERVKERIEVETEIEGIKTKVNEKSLFEQEIDKTDLLIRTKESALSSLNREIESIKKSLSENKEVFSEEEYQSIVLNIKSKEIEQSKLEAQKIELKSHLSSLERGKQENLFKRERIFKIDICPTCLQDVSENHKHNIINETEKEVSDIKRKTSSLQEQAESLEFSLKSIEQEKSELEKRKLSLDILKSKETYLSSSKLKLEDLEKQRKTLETDISLLEKHIQSLKENILSFSKFESQYKIKNNDLSSCLQKEKKVEISLAEMKKELELTYRERENLGQMINEKEGSRKKLVEQLELIDWFSSQFLSLVNFTEKSILMKLRLDFSRLFSKWFNMLVDQDVFEVHLDETFSPIIIQGGVEMDYNFLSGGERTATALAYRLALNQTINSAVSKIRTKGLVILDEPTDGFSEAQLDKMRDVLEELKAKQLIIVSHEQKIESFVDHTLRLIKDQDSTSIEGEIAIQ